MLKPTFITRQQFLNMFQHICASDGKAYLVSQAQVDVAAKTFGVVFEEAITPDPAFYQEVLLEWGSSALTLSEVMEKIVAKGCFYFPHPKKPCGVCKACYAKHVLSSLTKKESPD